MEPGGSVPTLGRRALCGRTWALLFVFFGGQLHFTTRGRIPASLRFRARSSLSYTPKHTPSLLAEGKADTGSEHGRRAGPGRDPARQDLLGRLTLATDQTRCLFAR